MLEGVRAGGGGGDVLGSSDLISPSTSVCLSLYLILRYTHTCMPHKSTCSVLSCLLGLKCFT